MEHKTVQGIGTEIHYWISRSDEANETIVFTHGLTADHRMFEKQVNHFKDNYTVIVWDVPMHGLSIPCDYFSYENCAKDLNKILIEENIEKVHLVGMSMGGYVMQMFAHLYPQKSKCFIGIDTTPFGLDYYSKSDLWWLSKVKPMAKCIPDLILRQSMAKSVSMSDYSYHKMMEILTSKTKEEIIEQMDIAYGKFVRENKELDIKCPALILLGDHDYTGKVKDYCKAWSKKTGYPLRIIKNASHFSNGDNPIQVNFEIEQFIKEQKKTDI